MAPRRFIPAERTWSGLSQYGVALAATALAFFVQQTAWPYMSPSPFAVFGAAVMLSSWQGGWGPGLLSTALSALLAHFFFMTPPGSLAEQREHLTSLLLFAASGVVITWLNRTRQASGRRARQNEEWLLTTLRSIGDGVIATDRAGGVTFMNPVAESLTGWTLAEAEGKPLTDVFRIINEQTRQPMENPAARVMRERRVVGLANHTILLSKTGREYVIEDSGAPISFMGSRVEGVVLVFRDATDKRLADLERSRLVASEREARKESELQRSHLAMVFQQAPVMIATVQGPEHVFEILNPPARRMFGSRQVVGRPAREVLADLVGQGFLERLDCTCATGEPFHGKEMLARVPRAGGGSEDLYLNVVYQPVRGADGEVEGVMLFAIDVTEEVVARQRIEALAAEVRRSEERHRALILATSELTWSTPPSGDFVAEQPAWRAFTGQTFEQVQGRGWLDAIHPEDRAYMAKTWDEALASKSLYEAQVRVRRKDGVYRLMLVRAVPVLEPDGSVREWVGIHRDITEQKQSEEATRFLAEAGNLLGASLDYQQTLQNLANLLVPRMADWCGVYMLEEGNPVPKQLVVTHAEPSKVAWAKQLDARFPVNPDAPRGIAAVIRTGQPELYTDIPDELLAATFKDPEHLALLRKVGFRSLLSVPLTARGRTFGAICLIAAESGRRYGAHDLSLARELADRAAYAVDNARLYNEAQEAIRIRDDFLSIASHELKTPLTPLQLHIQSMRRGRQGASDLPPKVAAKLDTIGRQVGRLEKLVNSLLDISRITHNRLDLQVEEVDLTGLAAEVTARFREEAGRVGGKLILHAPAPVIGTWDKLRLDQILSNLLSNAIKFGSGKPIEVSVEAVDGLAQLIVRDSGIGIAEKDQARVFERFERAVTSRHYGGFGLGLWIVRQIVESLGGEIRVASEVRKGSTFIVTLPLRPAEDWAAPAHH